MEEPPLVEGDGMILLYGSDGAVIGWMASDGRGNTVATIGTEVFHTGNDDLNEAKDHLSHCKELLLQNGIPVGTTASAPFATNSAPSTAVTVSLWKPLLSAMLLLSLCL